MNGAKQYRTLQVSRCYLRPCEWFGGGQIEVEQMDSEHPLVVHGLYRGCYRQHYRRGAEEIHERARAIGSGPARVSVLNRFVFVRAAICCQMAQRANRMT